MKASVFNKTGKEVKKVDLPESVFGLPWNGDLVHQVLVALESNKRAPIAHTKDRSEVRGGGAKPWRQKGTGRARHGSRRSPIWVGGGVTFGPRNDRNFTKKVNKKMRVKALYTLLSEKMRNGQVIFVDSLDFDTPKTKDAKAVLESLSKSADAPDLVTRKNNAVLLSLGEKNPSTEKSFSNFGNVSVEETRNLNALDVARAKYVVISDADMSLEFLEKRNSPVALIAEGTEA